MAKIQFSEIRRMVEAYTQKNLMGPDILLEEIQGMVEQLLAKIKADVYVDHQGYGDLESVQFILKSLEWELGWEPFPEFLEQRNKALFGTVWEGKACHARVKIRPVSHRYEDPYTEEPYMKYTCPVCALVGGSRVGIPEGSVNCPICGVALDWGMEEPIREGDKVLLLSDHRYYQVGKVAQNQYGPGALYVLTNEDTTGTYTREAFSLVFDSEVDG